MACTLDKTGDVLITLLSDFHVHVAPPNWLINLKPMQCHYIRCCTRRCGLQILPTIHMIADIWLNLLQWMLFKSCLKPMGFQGLNTLVLLFLPLSCNEIHQKCCYWYLATLISRYYKDVTRPRYIHMDNLPTTLVSMKKRWLKTVIILTRAKMRFTRVNHEFALSSCSL